MIFGQRPVRRHGEGQLSNYSVDRGGGLPMGLFHQDIEGHTHFYGVIFCPPRINTEREAQLEIRRIFERVVQEVGGDWDYDQVIAALVDAGFYDHTACGVWVE